MQKCFQDEKQKINNSVMFLEKQMFLSDLGNVISSVGASVSTLYKNQGKKPVTNCESNATIHFDTGL